MSWQAAYLTKAVAQAYKQTGDIKLLARMILVMARNTREVRELTDKEETLERYAFLCERASN